MQLGEKLAEGKTKAIYAHPDDPALAYMVHKDSITAGDGARRNVIEGKGALSCRTTSNVFRLLAEAALPVHFIDRLDATTMLVRRCQMLPLEVVMRRIATGSYLKRHPEVAEGTRFEPVLVEFFLKDDARHDPQITPEDISREGLASAGEVEAMAMLGRKTFEVLEKAWAQQDVTLVDMKIEFGRSTEGDLLVADVIDNDSWRIWPGGQREKMLDKQVYREMKQVDDSGLNLVLEKYAQVADLTEKF
ncbi:MAG: phosphoribosylaminoimidazolesuccinocarboxamide synthase [Planctomycetes bacterium]|nr:phosphoribosylaminoimidazolesuccinocarboxamide synthase [Planctomycetota bacterium]